MLLNEVPQTGILKLTHPTWITTKSWDIHKSLLRPNMFICEELGFEPSPSGNGYQGGVILIEINDSNKKGFQVKYYYTDIIILCGLRDNIIKVIDTPSEGALNTFVKKINEGTSHEKITIYKNMFLEAKTPASLLALMGMHSNENTGLFRHHIQKIAEPCIEEELGDLAVEKLAENINSELKNISNSIAL